MSTYGLKEADINWVEETVNKITEKMAWVSEKSKYKIPYSTDKNGTHKDCLTNEFEDKDQGLNWWTNGFWGGIQWMLYQETGEDKYADIARYSEEKLDQCFADYYGLHHDVGFMWLPTAVADYKLTGNKESRKRGLHAANLLAGRYNPIGKFIRAWNCEPDDKHRNEGWAIIDCMMNIPLLYWASEETKDPRFKHIALLHADTVMENFVRPDGSVHHIVEFDAENGGVIQSFGGQGYEVGSSWSRGQAWGLYGFIISYIHTGKVEYLDTAKRIAHYFIANIPESGVIPVDFRQPKEPALEDCCAASIACCGLLEIAKNVGELEKDIYVKAALTILKAIDKTRASWGKECDSIVLNCTAAYHNPNDRHITMVYADSFFIEAMLKLKENDYFIW